eukprot:4887445-Alexandrium_andersonii.AAC.1
MSPRKAEDPGPHREVRLATSSPTAFLSRLAKLAALGCEQIACQVHAVPTGACQVATAMLTAMATK